MLFNAAGLVFAIVAAGQAAEVSAGNMPWGDTTRLSRPFAKDPSVIRFGNRYLLYYSIPSSGDAAGPQGWAIGIAESSDLRTWSKTGEILPEQGYEAKGICAPFAKVLGKKIHLFYQTYGNGKNDAICHATSSDGLHFERDKTNPIFHPSGNWNAGRAIDAEVTFFRGRWYLYAATRDPAMKVQMIVGAWAAKGTDFSRNSWTQLPGGPLLKPELPWERDCIEAPSTLRRGRSLYMFYAGAFNNAPQQIGVAKSKDGVHWRRLSAEPLLRAGGPGSWNESESGHPAIFQQGRHTYLFFQGNNDKGKTWRLSSVPIQWNRGRPQLQR